MAESSPMSTTCPGCGRRYRIEPEQIGKWHRCKHCGQQFTVTPSSQGSPLTLNALSITSSPTASLSGSHKILSPTSSSLGMGSLTGSIATRMSRVTEESSIPSEWQVGDRFLDLYEVVGILGSGAMGRVYRVKHLGWNLDLAVKSPRQEVLSRSGAENFEREAEVWVNLGLHPHTVTCYYVRRLGGIPRVFAEFVQGGSLQQWIREGKLTQLERILDVAIQFAWGLDYAHEQGLVHQDIKPENVMLTPTGIAKVTDFGLARAASSGDGGISLDTEDLTNPMTGTLSATLGGMTPAYCSPEQWRGAMLARAGVPKEDRPKMTRKTDMWSWAVSILEIFTGKVIWQGGENADQALASYREHPTGLPIPDPIAELLMACLQRDPQDRPKDMGVLADHLQAIYASTTGQSYPRRRPQSDRALADSLNNRAVSLVDLGKSKEAIALWNRALQADPQHLESLYNRGLVQWRQGQISDEELVEALQQKTQDFRDWLTTYLVSQIHLERRFPQAIAPLWYSSDPSQETVAAEIATLAERSQAGAYQVLANFTAHEQPILAVDLSASHILSGSQDGTVKLWTRSGSLVHTFYGHTDMVTAVCFRPDGKVAYSGSRDGQIRVWDLVKGQLLRVIPAHRNSIHSLQWHPEFLLSGSYDNTLRLWDPETGQEKRSFQGYCWTAAVASQDGRYCYGAGYRCLRGWEQASQEVLTTLELPQTVYQICLDQAAEYALLVSGHPTINPESGQDLELWHLVKGKRVRRLQGHTAGITCAWLSPDHQQALSAGRDQRLKVWEIRTGRCLCTLTTSSPVYALARHEQHVVLGLESGSLVLWQMADQALWSAPMMLSRVQDSQAIVERETAYDQAMTKARHALAAGEILEAAESVVRARSLVGCRRRSDAMALWQSLYTRLPRERLQDAWFYRTLTLANAPTSVIHTPTQVWIGDEAGHIQAWDPHSPVPERDLQGHTDAITVLACDGQTLLSGSEDTTLKLWDPDTGQCLHTLVGHSAYITACGLSRDRVFSASYHDQTLRSWHRRTGRLEHLYTDRVGVTDLCLSLDQQTLVICGYELIEVWDVRSRQRHLSLPGVQDMIRSIALSSNGRYVLAGSYDHTLSLWDLHQQTCLRTFTGHTDWVTRVALSLDGRFGFSSSRDRTARLWDLTTGECLYVFSGHRAAITDCALAPDLRWLITASHDQTVRCWLLDWELSTPPLTWDISPYVRAWGQDPELLRQRLGWAGYGWLTPEQIDKERQALLGSDRLEP
jgi:predicted Zn finger-like uncharacterized protein